MAIGTLDAFQHVPRVEWVCSVLKGEGLLRTSDVITAPEPEGMLACDAGVTFVQRHRKARDGEVHLRIRAANGSLDFVTQAKWWPPVCRYVSAFADWAGR
jgi:hypothetical protein